MRIMKAFAVAMALQASLTSGVRAQDQPEGVVWESATELSYVSTGGNASATSFGLNGVVTGTQGQNRFGLEAGGIRASTEFRTRTAVGTSGSFTVREAVRSEETAESYFARGRYDRELGIGYIFGGAGWARNTFAGIQNRYGLVAGLGRTFVEGERGRLKADLGLTYTIQKDVQPLPGAGEGFGGAQASIDAARRISETAELASKVVVDESFQDTDDVRADWESSLSVAMNSRLALKTSLRVLFDNRPALVEVPLETVGGVPTGTVLTENEKVDRVLTLTVVIKL